LCHGPARSRDNHEPAPFKACESPPGCHHGPAHSDDAGIHRRNRSPNGAGALCLHGPDHAGDWLVGAIRLGALPEAADRDHADLLVGLALLHRFALMSALTAAGAWHIGLAILIGLDQPGDDR